MLRMIISLFIGIIWLSASSYTQAQEQFLFEYAINYTVEPSGSTKVIQDIKIINNQNDLIATNYELNIKQLEIDNLRVYKGEDDLDFEVKEKSNETTITVEFEDFVVGEGKSNNFTIEYTSQDLAYKTGSIWQVNIPRVSVQGETSKFDVTLNIPKELGTELFMSPNPKSIIEEENNVLYQFDLESISQQAISASFGKFQQYKFNLKYDLQNNNVFPTTQKIALPPDVHRIQQIRYIDIQPDPKSLYLDKEGNVIAVFNVSGNSTLEIMVAGEAKISGHQINPSYGGKMENIPWELLRYTKPTEYWQTKSDIIKTIADELYDPDATVSENARRAFDFTVTNLEYDFDTANKDFVERKGALLALTERFNNVCMEFTDVFITLTRAMGIPAREINGYAQGTERENDTPLSISFNGTDVLHAWAEFYDPSFGWVQVDPTWQKTSGADYFTKLDTNHLAFVVKGLDPEYPLPAGAYRTDLTEQQVHVELMESSGDSHYPHTVTIFEKPFPLLRNDSEVIIYLDVNAKKKAVAPGEILKLTDYMSGEKIYTKNSFDQDVETQQNVSDKIYWQVMYQYPGVLLAIGLCTIVCLVLIALKVLRR